MVSLNVPSGGEPGESGAALKVFRGAADRTEPWNLLVTTTSGEQYPNAYRARRHTRIYTAYNRPGERIRVVCGEKRRGYDRRVQGDPR